MNTEAFQPIQTSIGILSGRDAIYLDQVQYDISVAKLTLTGSLNGTLASMGRDEYFYDYSLTFVGIQSFHTIELDLAFPHKGRSSFDQVLNSKWLSHLQAVDARSHQTSIDTCNHYRLWTYDNVFDVICLRYELTIQLDNPRLLKEEDY